MGANALSARRIEIDGKEYPYFDQWSGRKSPLYAGPSCDSGAGRSLGNWSADRCPDSDNRKLTHKTGSRTMVDIENRKRPHFGTMKCAAGSLALAIVYTVSSGLWSGGSWAQRTRTEFNSPVRQETQPNRPEPPSVSPASPITFPATDASSPLGKALASCEPKADASELSLPAARGEIKLDRCYRGRDHLVCQFNALMAEANSLLENYPKILHTNYPKFPHVAGIS